MGRLLRPPARDFDAESIQPTTSYSLAIWPCLFPTDTVAVLSIVQVLISFSHTISTTTQRVPTNHGRSQEQSLPHVSFCILLKIFHPSCSQSPPSSVHDGWGVAAKPGLKGDAIEAGDTTNMDTLAKEYCYRKLAAHGLAVGLSDGLMGNSEVGYARNIPRNSFIDIIEISSHLNIGAGRVVWQDIVRIDVAIKKRQFHRNEQIVASCKHAKDGNGRLHFLGLVSAGFLSGFRRSRLVQSIHSHGQCGNSHPSSSLSPLGLSARAWRGV